ncbi:MAG: hypothetical protein WCN95_12320, partial [bacterium]
MPVSAVKITAGPAFRALRTISLLLLAASLNANASLFDDVKRDTEALSAYSSRVPGTEGHRKAQRDMLAHVQGITNVQVWTQEFPVVAPVVSRAVIKISNGPMAGEHPIFPIWPDLVRLKTTPSEGISGELTYVGSARLDDLPARSLHGKIAIMEMSASENWKQPFSMGASAVIFLGSPGDRAVQPARWQCRCPPPV